MMKKIILYIILLFVAGACSDDVLDTPNTPALPDGTPVDIVAAASLPELNFAHTRAMGDQPTAEELLNTLKVNLFVFDQAGIMTQFIGPESISVKSIDEPNNMVYFNVQNIYSSSVPRRLHFVVTSAPDLHDVPGGEYIDAMAGENTVMPALLVNGDTDAYWGMDVVNEVTADMKLAIKLIRNFAKISVKSEENPAKFKLLGYTVVNRPAGGTIAPYIAKDHLFATFLDPDDTLLSYEEITAQEYYGVNPAGIGYTHTTEAEVQSSLNESERKLSAGATDTPYYIYERTQSGMGAAGDGAVVSYIIVVGEYEGQRCYYKIDIGRDHNGKFRYYDLLRNFQYTLNITEVGGMGSTSLRDAMNGAPHNNLSSSVVTRDLFSIGYDGEKIEVSSTRVIFTEQTSDYIFRFTYTVPSGSTFDISKMMIYDLGGSAEESNMSGATVAKPLPLLQGEVIESASVKCTALSSNGGSFELTVNSKGMPADSRRLEQNLRIYYAGSENGLGRTVTFMLRQPWQFGTVTHTHPGTAMSAAFDITVPIPSGLAKTQFPLVIAFESDKQNIYAKPGSPLTVSTGASGFRGAGTDPVISYERRIEWEEYAAAAGGLTINAPFLLNTTAAEDKAYDTTAIMTANPGLTNDNNTNNFYVRISNTGQKYIEPYYVFITRN